MKYLKKYKLFEGIDSDSKLKLEIVDYLETLPDLNSKWEEDTDIPEHWKFQFKYDLSNDFYLSIIGLRDSNNNEGFKIIAYLDNKKDDEFYYIDDLIRPYNKLILLSEFASPQNRINWCIRIAKEQLQYFEDREKLPSDDELKNVLLVDFVEDIGFTLDSINYGYINEFEPKPVSVFRNLYTLDEEPYFSKNHKSSSKPKIVISFSQKNLQDVTEEKVESEFEISLKKIELQGYDVDSELYFTSNRYYNGEWRPESFLIIIQLNK